MLAKRTAYRSKKLTQSAKGKPCTMNSPWCINDPETTVFCHFNEQWAGKGTSQKADDCAGFYGCWGCHSAYADGRLGKQTDFSVLRAYSRTIRMMLDEGEL